MDAWLQPILDLVSTLGGRGGTVLAFPECRPDLAKAIAHAVGIRFYDFRAEAMAQKGFQAGTMGLDELDAVLAWRKREEKGGKGVRALFSLLSTYRCKDKRGSAP